jgi:iron complex outermembrane recepter protein
MTGKRRNPVRQTETRQLFDFSRRWLLPICALPSSLLFLASQAAWAQDDEEATIEEVVVTGSRIIRRDLVAPSPVVVVGAEAIRGSGNITLEETLNEMPQLRPETTRAENVGGGSGVLTADLRGLGPARTLVLVDGRRYIPASTDGLVDLATIPDMLIERVEVISGGASAVYGSDAVAGAVNFILRDDFEGIESRYQFGETAEGDGTEHKADFIWGIGGDDARGNAVLYASYTEGEAVMMGDRAFSRNALVDGALLGRTPGEFTTFGSSNIPGGALSFSASQMEQIVGVDFGTPGALPPGAIGPEGQCTAVAGVRFDEQGAPVPFCSPEDTFNFSPDNFLLRPFERWQLGGTAEYDLSDNVTGYGQVFYTQKTNAYQQAPLATSIESTGAPPGVFQVPNADINPLFSPATRQFFADNRALFGAEDDDVWDLQNLRRRFEEFGPRENHFQTDSWSITAGLTGDIRWAGDTWTWDAFYQHQQADERVIQEGFLSSLRIALASDVILDPDTGQPVCRNDFIGCVPANVFGVDAITEEQANFLSIRRMSHTNFERQVAGATVAGNLFELPSGPIGSAFGLEWRRDSFAFTPSAVDQAGEFGTPAPVPNSGEFDVFEAFGEVLIPVLRDAPLAQAFDLELGARFTDYSTIGTVWTWKAGGDWSVNEWVRFRGMFNRAIRAPSLDELFRSPSSGFVPARDPCETALNPSQEVRDFCVALGVPAGDIDNFTFPESGYDQVQGGNPGLQEESSDTFTVGAVLGLPFAPGANVTIDYWDIVVDDAIDAVSGPTIVDLCFQTLDVNSPFCQAIDRFPSGHIRQVSATLQNIAELEARGLDLQVDYGLDLPGALALPGREATLDLRVISSWQFEASRTPFQGAADIDCAGKFSGPCSGQLVSVTPDFRANLSATWNSGPLMLRLQGRYVGELDRIEGGGGHLNKIDSVIYADLNGRYQLTEDIEVFAGIKNVFDKQPPIFGVLIAGDSNTEVNAYDTIGRRFFVGAGVRF